MGRRVGRRGRKRKRAYATARNRYMVPTQAGGSGFGSRFVSSSYLRPNRYGIGMRPRNQVGVPANTWIKLRYTEVLASTGGSFNQVNYIMNGLFDPQYNKSGYLGGNGQPLYRDQWASFYYQYRVYGYKITATWTPINLSGQGVPCKTTMILMPADTPITDGNNMVTKQRKGCKWVDTGGAFSSVKRCTLKAYSNIHSVLGLTKRQYSDEFDTKGIMGGTGTNPQLGAFMSVAVQGESAVGLSGYLDVSMTFYCKLFDVIENIGPSFDETQALPPGLEKGGNLKGYQDFEGHAYPPLYEYNDSSTDYPTGEQGPIRIAGPQKGDYGGVRGDAAPLRAMPEASPPVGRATEPERAERPSSPEQWYRNSRGVKIPKKV